MNNELIIICLDTSDRLKKLVAKSEVLTLEEESALNILTHTCNTIIINKRLRSEMIRVFGNSKDEEC